MLVHVHVHCIVVILEDSTKPASVSVLEREMTHRDLLVRFSPFTKGTCSHTKRSIPPLETKQ